MNLYVSIYLCWDFLKTVDREHDTSILLIYICFDFKNIFNICSTVQKLWAGVNKMLYINHAFRNINHCYFDQFTKCKYKIQYIFGLTIFCLQTSFNSYRYICTKLGIFRMIVNYMTNRVVTILQIPYSISFSTLGS